MHAFDNRDPAAMLRLADHTSLTVIDEAHQAIAPTYASILTTLHTKRSKNALLGLTATPGRTWSDIAEDQKLSDYFEGHKVTLEAEGYDDPVNFLIEEGYLARPILRTLNSGAGLELSEQERSGTLGLNRHSLCSSRKVGGRYAAQPKNHCRYRRSDEPSSSRYCLRPFR